MDTIKCPKCGKEMIKGFVYAERRLKWSNNDQKNMVSYKDKTILPINMGVRHKKHEAFQCFKCRIVTLEF